jgi:hypothetical protein
MEIQISERRLFWWIVAVMAVGMAWNVLTWTRPLWRG